MKKAERFSFLDSFVDPLSMEQTLSIIDDILKKGTPSRQISLNVAKLMSMLKDRRYLDVVNSADIVNADGMGIVLGARLLGSFVPERVAGIDLMLNVISLAAEKGYKVYFLGSYQDVLIKVSDIMLKRFPDLVISGFHHGYFSKDEENTVVEGVKQSGADVLFVGIPSPQKEYFVKRYLEELGVSFAMGVGGSFDVIAGKVKRSPLWAQRYGLEWFFRMAQEPGRMWKRYLFSNFSYLLILLKALCKKKKR